MSSASLMMLLRKWFGNLMIVYDVYSIFRSNQVNLWEDDCWLLEPNVPLHFHWWPHLQYKVIHNSTNDICFLTALLNTVDTWTPATWCWPLVHRPHTGSLVLDRLSIEQLDPQYCDSKWLLESQTWKLDINKVHHYGLSFFPRAIRLLLLTVKHWHWLLLLTTTLYWSGEQPKKLSWQRLQTHPVGSSPSLSLSVK